jgi:hypothetical protein
MKWFLPFMGFIFISELYMIFQTRVLREEPIKINFIIAIVESFFYGFIFYQLFENKFFKKCLLVFTYLSVLLYVVAYLYNGKTLKYFLDVIMIYGFGLTAFAMLYLVNNFTDDSKSRYLTQSGFWISVGIALFYSGVSVAFPFFYFIKENNINILGEKIVIIIPRVLCFILYLCLSISIILCKRQTKVSY